MTYPRSVIVPDCSFYQDDPTTIRRIDFATMRAAGAPGVIIRAGQRSYMDRDFVYNWKSAKNAGLLRGAYWFYDSRHPPLAQAALFSGILQTHGLPEMEAWCDYEETYGGAYAGWRHFAVFVAELQRLIPHMRVGIYTSYGYWRDHSPNSLFQRASYDWFAQFPLWLAQYNVEPTLVPGPWKAPLYWQFTAKGPGAKYGVESLSIDLSYFNGDLAGFLTRYNVVPPPPPVVDKFAVNSVSMSGAKIDGMVTVNVTHNGVTSDVILDQRVLVPPPPPVVPPSTKLYRIKDDIEAGLKVNGGTRPGDPVLGDNVIRSGWPATVRYHSEVTVIENGVAKKRAGRSNIKLTPEWLGFARAINPDLAYKYQFDDAGNLRLHVGWCNVQENVVEYVTFGGVNEVEVTRIEGDRAYIKCFHINEKPPAVPSPLPMPGSVSTLIQMFTVQYATYLDATAAGPRGPRYPRTFLIAAEGEEIWMDIHDLVEVV